MKRGKKVTEAIRIDAARRILSGSASIEDVCAEYNMERQTVRSWVDRVDSNERDVRVNRWHYVLRRLSWKDPSAFDRLSAQLAPLLEPYERADRLDVDRQKDEYDRAMAEQYAKLHNLPASPNEPKEEAN